MLKYCLINLSGLLVFDEFYHKFSWLGLLKFKVDFWNLFHRSFILFCNLHSNLLKLGIFLTNLFAILNPLHSPFILLFNSLSNRFWLSINLWNRNFFLWKFFFHVLIKRLRLLFLNLDNFHRGRRWDWNLGNLTCKKMLDNINIKTYLDFQMKIILRVTSSALLLLQSHRQHHTLWSVQLRI